MEPRQQQPAVTAIPRYARREKLAETSGHRRGRRLSPSSVMAPPHSGRARPENMSRVMRPQRRRNHTRSFPSIRKARSPLRSKLSTGYASWRQLSHSSNVGPNRAVRQHRIKGAFHIGKAHLELPHCLPPQVMVRQDRTPTSGHTPAGSLLKQPPIIGRKGLRVLKRAAALRNGDPNSADCADCLGGLQTPGS